jgi:co-chaperonin GroES (HSP10)
MLGTYITETIMIQPQGNRVLVELSPYEDDVLELPDTHREVLQTATVVAVGEGSITKDGGLITANVGIGDRVIISQTGGTMVKDGDRQYQVVSPENIVGGIE